MHNRLKTSKAFILDMDGTLVLGNKDNSGDYSVLPGADEFLALLRTRDIPFRIFTNGTAYAPDVYAGRLRDAGFDITNEEMMTPSTVAADYFVEKGLRRVLVLGREGVWKPLADAGIETFEGVAGRGLDVDAIYVGWFRDFTFADLEAGTEAVWNGAAFTTCSDVPFFAAAGGRSIGTSFAINAMIGALTEQAPIVLGKPSSYALECAVRRMGLEGMALKDVVVIGDDPALEMRMANDAGALSVGVASGLETIESLTGQPEEKRPLLAIDNMSELLELM